MSPIPLTWLHGLSQRILWQSRWGALRGRHILDVILIVVGALLTATAVVMFFDPNDVVPGGFTALAMFANRLWGWPVGITLLALNVPFFILGVRSLGPSFGPKTILAATVSSLAIDALQPLLPAVKGEPLLYTLYGGLIYGLGMGIVFRANAITGGTETPAKLLQHHFGVRLSRSLLAMDVVVLLLAAILFGLAPALYALIASWLMTRVVDYMELGAAASDTAFIVTSEPEAVRQAILGNLNRGVTLLPATGGYTGEERVMLFTVVSRREVQALRQLVSAADASAFMVISPSSEVLGEGFQPFHRLAPGRAAETAGRDGEAR